MGKSYKKITIDIFDDHVRICDNQRSVNIKREPDSPCSEDDLTIDAIKKFYGFPQIGNIYYRVSVDGDIFVQKLTFNDDYYDNLNRDFGNFYETEEEAQKVADKIKMVFKKKE